MSLRSTLGQVLSLLVIVVVAVVAGCPAPDSAPAANSDGSSQAGQEGASTADSAPAAGSDDSSQVGQQAPSTADWRSQCPLVVSESPLYSVTVPCGSMRAEASETPGASFESYFYDDAYGYVYWVARQPLSSLPGFSSQSGQPGVASTISCRWGGKMRTSSGDTLILATARLSDGYSFEYAYGLLSNGELLGVGAESGNPFTLPLFISISLTDTDGENVGQITEGYPTLVSPVSDHVVLLSDGSVYEVSLPSDLRESASWTVADAVLVGGTAQFHLTADFFLTNRTTWVSVEADYVGNASKASIASVQKPEFGPTRIRLDDGSSWEVSYAESAEATTWQTGDLVALYADPSWIGHGMLRVSSGAAIGVKPAAP